MKIPNGRHNPKRNFRRNGAAIILAGALISGTACSSSQEDVGKQTGVVVGQLIKEKLDEEYGLNIDELLAGSPSFAQERVFSRQSLGRTGEDLSSDYDPEETFDPSNGPISLKIAYVNGTLRVKDLSRDGVDEALMLWILNRLSARMEIIKAAGETDAVTAVNIRLNATDVLMQDDPTRLVTTMSGDATNENEVNIVFPRSAVPISAEVFDQMFVHEISHLLADAASDDYLKDGQYSQEVDRMLNVCASIRSKAIEQLDSRLYGVITKLDRAVAIEDSPQRKETMRTLLNKYVDRSYIGLLPDSDPKYVEVQEPQFGERATQCAHNTLSRQLGMVETQLGVPFDKESFGEFLDSPASDPFYEAYDELLELLQESTIYKYLAEINYDPRNNFGHGYDNLNEQFATAIALLVNPESTATKLASATSQERELVVEFIDSSREVLTAKFPQLTPLFHACNADFQSALNGQSAYNLETCQPAFFR